MSDLFLKKSIFLFVLLTSFWGEGRHTSEKYSIIINQTQTVNPPKSAKEEKVDTKKSIIRWKGTKLMRTGKHEGTLKLKEGILLFEDDRLIGGYFIADMNSIEITDMPAHETTAIRNLTTHLKSDFDVPQYPTSKFEITRVEYLNNYMLKIRGNMTIKDVTRNISIPAQIDLSEKNHKKATTKFTFDRLAWNIGRERSWLEKKLVDKEIELRIEIITK